MKVSQSNWRFQFMVRKSLLSLVVLAGFASAATAQTVNIKLATQAPVNSSYHKALLDMGAEWEAKTSGRVKLTIYAGGTQGSEEATLRMMRPGVDQLQGNLLMLPGLSSIDDAFSVFGIPFFFASGCRRAGTCWRSSGRCSTSASSRKVSSCSPGQRRLGAAVFEDSHQHARRPQSRKDVHDAGGRPHGAVVQAERLPPGRAQFQRHPGAAQTQHRNDRRRADAAKSDPAHAGVP
jgi:hypothetical protein